MRTILSTLVIIATSGACLFAQPAVGPHVVVLVPTVIARDSVSGAELARTEVELVALYRTRIEQERTHDVGPGMQWYRDNNNALVHRLTLGTVIALAVKEFAMYNMYEALPGFRIVVDEREGRTFGRDVRAIATRDSAGFVIRFDSIAIARVGDRWSGSIRAALYDAAADSIVRRVDITANDESHGGELSCAEGTLECVLVNGVSALVDTMMHEVHERDPGTIGARRAQSRQLETLRAGWRSWRKQKAILPLLPTDSALLNRGALFFADMSPDRSRFVALFVEDADRSKTDEGKHVTVMNSEGYPFKALGYVVSGVKHEGRWYHSRKTYTAFGAKDLDDARDKYIATLIRAQWFRALSTDRNADYWSTGEFAVLLDPASGSEYDPTSSYDRNRRADYLGYYGLPRIVAEGRRNADEARRAAIDDTVVTEEVVHRFARLHEAGIEPYAQCDSALWYQVFSDSSQRRLLVPMKIGCIGEEHTLLYWVLLQEEGGRWITYEWTKLPRLHLTTWRNTALDDALTPLTDFDMSYPWIRDERFWTEHVLVREGGDFTYLREIGR